MIRKNFSVLLSVYCKENPEYLDASLQSIFSQTLLPSEVIIVEDGPLTSELTTVLDSYMERFSSIKVVRLKENCGLGSALAEGLKHSTFDIVVH